ncbi:DNA/RNA nuclease SfsA [Persicimonas caeni]|nr:DNA/RNA nuclease SfsA [Persicimonas caeni]
MKDTPTSTPRIPLGGGAPLVEARFVERPNQFVVIAELDGEQVKAHMADRGRLLDVLVPGRPLLLAHRPAPHRKTDYSAVAAVVDGRLVSLDTQLPNKLVARALEADVFEEVAGYAHWRKEKTIGGSRFDFWLEDGERRVVLEVKSVGRLDADGVARFPDAPTSRGRRHVEELAELAGDENTRAVLCFLVQGEHADRVEVDTDIDPKLHRALVEAREQGVEVYARRCSLDRDGLCWGTAVPVEL